MPTYFNNLDTLLEQACAALIAAAGVTATAGMDATEIEPPCAICHAQGGEEFPQYSGNFWQTASITVMSVGEVASSATLTAHKTLCAQVFDLFVTDDTRSDLTAAATAFGVIGIRNRRIADTKIEDRKWISELTFEALVCATDL